MTTQSGKQLIALDFDGVLAVYHGWKAVDPPGTPGTPMPGMLETIRQIQEWGAEVMVFTTRPVELVKGWLAKHGFPPLEVTNEKLKRFDVFLDDRGLQFHPEMAADPQGLAQHLIQFEPHWKSRDRHQ